MKKKSTEIIDLRKKLDKDIAYYWKIIASENVMKNGTTRQYDLKELLRLINDLSNQRIQAKLDSLIINLGFSKRSDLPANSIFPTIYELSEKNEQLVKLRILETIDPRVKRLKGKKGLKVNEEITADYKKKLMDELQLEINRLSKILYDFNEKAELDISSAYMSLVA